MALLVQIVTLHNHSENVQCIEQNNVTTITSHHTMKSNDIKHVGNNKSNTKIYTRLTTNRALPNDTKLEHPD